jgi:hypothetical protein
MIWKDVEFEKGLGGGKLGPMKVRVFSFGKEMIQGTYEETTVQSFPTLSFDGVMSSSSFSCIGSSTWFALHLGGRRGRTCRSGRSTSSVGWSRWRGRLLLVMFLTRSVHVRSVIVVVHRS